MTGGDWWKVSYTTRLVLIFRYGRRRFQDRGRVIQRTWSIRYVGRWSGSLDPSLLLRSCLRSFDRCSFLSLFIPPPFFLALPFPSFPSCTWSFLPPPSIPSQSPLPPLAVSGNEGIDDLGETPQPQIGLIIRRLQCLETDPTICQSEVSGINL